MKVKTVKELIEELQKFPPEMEIWSGEIACAYIDAYHGVVFEQEGEKLVCW